MPDTSRAQNLSAVQPLLAGSPVRVRAADANEGMAAVDVDLATPTGTLRVRLEPNVPGRPAFARSASLSISHLGDGGAPLSSAQIGALRAFARHITARDRGGVVLRPPEVEAPGSGRALPVVQGDTAESSWSRELFDRNVERLAAEGRLFSTAILVVVQPCDMACRFCPSGDIARAVPPGLSSEQQYSDLYHQLAAARSLGADTLEIGGNDVLAFPGVIGLVHAAGRLGFRHVSAQSPGQRLADPRFAEGVAKSPLDRIDLPIYGATAEEHEAVTRTAGSFDGLCRAIDQALSLGRPAAALHTIALRSTLHRLDALLDFGQRRFGLHIRVELLRPNRVGERDHLTDAASLEEIAESARRHPSHFGGDIPLCALPAERARELFDERTAPVPDTGARGPVSAPVQGGVFKRQLHLWDLGLREGTGDAAAKRDRSAAFSEACDQCALRDGCPGVLQAYLDRFGKSTLPPFPRPS